MWWIGRLKARNKRGREKREGTLEYTEKADGKPWLVQMCLYCEEALKIPLVDRVTLKTYEMLLHILWCFRDNYNYFRTLWRLLSRAYDSARGGRGLMTVALSSVTTSDRLRLGEAVAFLRDQGMVGDVPVASERTRSDCDLSSSSDHRFCFPLVVLIITNWFLTCIYDVSLIGQADAFAIIPRSSLWNNTYQEPPVNQSSFISLALWSAAQLCASMDSELSVIFRGSYG